MYGCVNNHWAKEQLPAHSVILHRIMNIIIVIKVIIKSSLI